MISYMRDDNLPRHDCRKRAVLVKRERGLFV